MRITPWVAVSFVRRRPGPGRRACQQVALWPQRFEHRQHHADRREPAFGRVQLASLDVSLVDRFKGDQAHLAPNTVANHLTLLISMLNAAVELGWLRKVPKIKKPKIAVAEDYRCLKTSDEIERFLETAEPEDEPVRVMYRVAVYTGMRAGELAGLQWRDVDFSRRIVTVRRSYDRKPTKSGRIRHVPILDAILSVLKAWKLRHPGTWVFTNRDGNVNHRSSPCI